MTDDEVRRADEAAKAADRFLRRQAAADALAKAAEQFFRLPANKLCQAQLREALDAYKQTRQPAPQRPIPPTVHKILDGTTYDRSKP